MTSEFKNRQMQTNRPSKKLETKTRKLEEKKLESAQSNCCKKTGRTGIIEYY